MEKSKAQPHTRATNQRFYHYGWFYHFKFAAPKVMQNIQEMHIPRLPLAPIKARRSLRMP